LAASEAPQLIHQSPYAASLVPVFPLVALFLLIPKRSQSSPNVSLASSIAATNFTGSFIGDVSFQGMERRLHVHRERVTYVLVRFVTYVPGPNPFSVDSFLERLARAKGTWR
jgi:hypothetical protein